MSYKDEKPWLVIYFKREEQLDNAEHKAFLEGLDNGDAYVALKDKRVLSTKFEILKPNPHYVSEKSIKEGRRKREIWEEYQDLKNQGVVQTQQEYKVWKLESDKQMKKFQKKVKEWEGEENEEKRTT